MAIEIGVVVGYLIVWATRKAARAAGHADAIVDEAIDTGLDKLHDAVAARLGADPALAELERQAGDGDLAQVTARTRTRVKLALEEAAEQAEDFEAVLAELLTGLQAAEQHAGSSVVAGAGARVFAGDAHVEADNGGIAVGQVGGNVHVDRGSGDPPEPGRSSH